MPLLSQWIKKTMENVSFSIVFLVQEMGLEPTRIAPLVSEASLFANFNTPAYLTVVIIAYFLSKRNCIFPNVAKVVVLPHKIAVWSFGIEDFGSG